MKFQKQSFLIFSLMILLTLILSGIVYAAGTASGTTISNGGDGGTLGTADNAGDVVVGWTENGPLSPSATTSSVSSVYDATLSRTSPASQNGTVGSKVYYSYTVINKGNVTDTITLSPTLTSGGTSGGAWTAQSIFDTNGDGTHQTDESTVTTNTGPLAAEAAYKFFVEVTIPSGAADLSTGAFTLTAKNQSGAGTNDSWGVGLDTLTDLTTTTAGGPVIAVALIRDVDSVKPDDPGTPTVTDANSIITYTVSVNNSGSATANNVVITNKIPANTNYVIASLYYSNDGTAWTLYTDATDDDQGSVVSGLVTVGTGTLTVAPSSTFYVQYKVYVP